MANINGNKRGQAAMEYLMTYGWALLVIAIVISILVLINPFSSPQGCRFDTVGFTCDAPAFANVGGNTSLYLRMYNGNNNNILINSTYCTADKTSESPNSVASLPSPIMVPRQGNYTFGPQPCYRNGALMGASPAGSDFSGKLWVFYRNQEDPSNYPMRVASATISGKVSR